MGEQTGDDETPRVVEREQLAIKPIEYPQEDPGYQGDLLSESEEEPAVKPAGTTANDLMDMNAAIQRRKQQMLAAGSTSPAAPAVVIPSQIHGKVSPTTPSNPPVVIKSPAIATKKCPSCNAELPITAKFCNKCGFRF